MVERIVVHFLFVAVFQWGRYVSVGYYNNLVLIRMCVGREVRYDL